MCILYTKRSALHLNAMMLKNRNSFPDGYAVVVSLFLLMNYRRNFMLAEHCERERPDVCKYYCDFLVLGEVVSRCIEKANKAESNVIDVITTLHSFQGIENVVAVSTENIHRLCVSAP